MMEHLVAENHNQESGYYIAADKSICKSQIDVGLVNQLHTMKRKTLLHQEKKKEKKKKEYLGS